MSRVYNFNPGPAALPASVLEQVRDDLLDWQGCGMSVMEMSHRAEPFLTIASEAEADLRLLLGIPDNYKVLFMQGGATAQFSAVPMNLLRSGTTADYAITGTWSQKAAKEGAKYLDAKVVARPEAGQFSHIPPFSGWTLNEAAAFLHYTPNETIHGVEFHWTPRVDSVPLVADFSSSFLSRPVNVEDYGVIYAGAQKNAGTAGLTIVIVREDLVGHSLRCCPLVLDYKTIADSGSMSNTPPTFSWYVAGLIFKWLLAQGGLKEMAAANERKSSRLYRYIDSEPFYENAVATRDRSRINVVFTLADPAQSEAFLCGAKAAGFAGLKGHRLVGGMRASLYNAVPEAAVDALIDYMQDFVRLRG